MNKIIFSITILWSLMLFSCSTTEQNKNEENDQGVSQDTLANFDKQTFVVNPLKDTVIIGKKETKVKLNKETFKNPKGEMYSGSTTVELIEFYNLSEMVINNLTTETTNGEVLSTGGMVFINFIDSTGSPLSLVEGKSYELWFRKKDSSDKRDMHLFKGEWNKGDSPCIKWKVTDDSLRITDQIWGAADTASITSNMAEGTVDFYIFKSTQIGWINCDAFVNYERKDLLTKVSVQEETKAAYRLIDKRTKSIGVLYQERKNGKYEFNMVQTGNQYYLFSFYKKDGQYYSYLTDFVARKEGNEITPKFQKTDLEGLKIQAEKLDD